LALQTLANICVELSSVGRHKVESRKFVGLAQASYLNGNAL